MKAIQASPESINDLLQGHEFIIPEYQRPYSWGNEQCDRLWEDLSGFLERATDGVGDDNDQYFLGSIVVYPNPDDKRAWDVVDGQQRLTTLIMLVRAFFEKASTHAVLQKRIYREDPKSGEMDKSSPCLDSKVLGGADRKSFVKVLQGDLSALEKDKKNPFANNYKLLEKELTDWWKKFNTERRDKIINALLHNVVLLPIECNERDDALDLFQIINDRGKPLANADIFKAELYSAVAEDERESFVNQWNRIEPQRKDHEFMFRVFMHISRADRDDSGKESDLRKYVQEHHLKDKEKLSSEWQKIMYALEACHYAHYCSTPVSENTQTTESIYWGVLEYCPNTYWQYPLYVFLHKHMKRRGDDFRLPEEKCEEYELLLEDTARYFFLKSVVYNSVNAVKDTTFRVCADIAHERDYAAQYRENAEKKDLSEFERKIADSDLGRNRKGLVLLAAALNPNQDRVAYGEFLRNEKVDIEHILSQKWCNYDGWNDESHKRDINKIGNLMPLKKAINIKASNEFFKGKQEKYKNSVVQDALDLANKKPSVWYPEDVAARHEESLKRLREFFGALHR